VLVIVAYDVNTETAAGRRRLRKVAQTCMRYGQRVQKSVFECSLGERELTRLRSSLLRQVDLERDNLRFYLMTEAERQRIEAYGRGRVWDYDGPLII
jgi:CRISPR-associated protein Cas2